jgi:hypothetical protein
MGDAHQFAAGAEGQTIFVADGSSDTTRTLHLQVMHRRWRGSLAPGWPRQGGKG